MFCRDWSVGRVRFGSTGKGKDVGFVGEGVREVTVVIWGLRMCERAVVEG